jgi:hypothetical protein
VKKSLSNYKKNFFSQNGEDGIIQETLKRIGNSIDRQCCEVGAFDGMHLSNTYNLIKKKKYKALLIESNKKTYNKLLKNIPDSKIIKINEAVGFEQKNKLDFFLDKFNFNKDFDFLSIDIDGADYHVFKDLNIYKPKLICIEFNYTIPNDVIFIQEKKIKINQGSSAAALINLAKEKEYYPIAATFCNLFFIHKKYKKSVTGPEEILINKLINDSFYKISIFIGFDGSINLSKKLNLIWHGIKNVKLNFLPTIIQKYPPNYNFIEKILYYLFLLYNNPIKFFKNPWKYIKKIFYEKD